MAERPDGEQQTAIIASPELSLAWVEGSGSLNNLDPAIAIEIETPEGTYAEAVVMALECSAYDGIGEDAGLSAYLTDGAEIGAGRFLVGLETGQAFSWGFDAIDSTATTVLPADADGWRAVLRTLCITPEVPLLISITNALTGGPDPMPMLDYSYALLMRRQGVL